MITTESCQEILQKTVRFWLEIGKFVQT